MERFSDTTESFGPELLQSFLRIPEYKVCDSMIDGPPTFGGSETIILLQDGLDVRVELDKGHRLVGSVVASLRPARFSGA